MLRYSIHRWMEGASKTHNLGGALMETTSEVISPAAAETGLKRVLNTRDLIVYGIMMMFPLAPVALYGAVQQQTGGHLFLAYLVAMVAMLFTAFSYGAMAGAFPRAGSTYTFTRRGLNQHLGLLSGWAITLDYVLFPTLNMILVGLFGSAQWPQIHYWWWVVGAVVFVTFFNLREVRWLSRISLVLLIVSVGVLAWFVGAAIHSLSGGAGAGVVFSGRPIFNSATFHWGTLFAGTAIACFSFLGFDAVSTLAEETKRPARAVSVAMVVSLLVVTCLFLVQTYFSALLVPDAAKLTDPNTAYFTIFGIAGGSSLATVLTVALIAACLANAADSMGGAARLLFAMGRDSVIPKKVFGYLWPKSQTPALNVLLIAGLTLIGASRNLNTIINMINFGALLAFFFVNVSVINHFFIRQGRRAGFQVVRYLVAPAIGAGVIIWLWFQLSSSAWAVGGTWLGLGIIYTLFKTNLFRKPLPEYTGQV
jgi:amino acid transporter